LGSEAGAATTLAQRVARTWLVVRDPIVLDFVQLSDGAKERDLEAALLEQQVAEFAARRAHELAGNN